MIFSLMTILVEVIQLWL